MKNFTFNEIELECECDPDPQPSDSISFFDFMLTLVSLPNLDQFSEPTFIPVPIDLEIESPNLDTHIPLMGEEYEFQFFNLDSTLEPKQTLELKVDFPELVMVPEPITLEFKSIILPNHILLLDIGIDHNMTQ